MKCLLPINWRSAFKMTSLRCIKWPMFSSEFNYQFLSLFLPLWNKAIDDLLFADNNWIYLKVDKSIRQCFTKFSNVLITWDTKKEITIITYYYDVNIVLKFKKWRKLTANEYLNYKGIWLYKLQTLTYTRVAGKVREQDRLWVNYLHDTS